jgi:DNA-binding LytR/AlgR family response regulator
MGSKGTSSNSAGAAPRTLHQAGGVGDHPESGDRLASCDERRAVWTGGSWLVSNGGRTLGACLVVALIAAAVATVNALSILHDSARSGEQVAIWRPWATEYSSLLGLIASLPIVVSAEGFAYRRRWAPVGVVVALLGSLAFSLVHVLLMVALRESLWWAQGGDYWFDFQQDWLYEYRKDLIPYSFALGLLALARAVPQKVPTKPVVNAHETTRAQFLDGRRKIQIDICDLQAVRGEGNYVELIFSGERRKLLRSTLSAAEDVLGGVGFRRVHRSWLIRLDAVAESQRTNSGDYSVRLRGGQEVSVSRRQREVIAELKSRLSTGDLTLGEND